MALKKENPTEKILIKKTKYDFNLRLYRNRNLVWT